VLDPAATTLILIDFQREYFDPAKLPIPDGAVAAANAALLVSAADKVGVKVIHVQHLAASPTSPLFAPGSPNAQFVDPVKPRADEEIVVKSTPSSFVKTNLDATLEAAGIETLVVTGLATHMCIDSTTRDAVSHGYEVIVVDDACASRDLPGPGGSIVPADVVHSSTLAALGDRFADIMRTSEVVTLLGRCSPARRHSAAS